jgi:hypothetical protein
MDFDFRGPNNEPLSLYKRSTNKQLDFGLLMGMVAQLGLELESALRERLALLVADNSPPSERVEEITGQLQSVLVQADPSIPELHEWVADTANLAAQLANSSILWAPIAVRRGTDCIVKFSYLDSYGRAQRHWPRQLLISCSWHDRVLYIPLPHAGQHTRYHVDLRTPKGGVEFLRVQTRALPALFPASGYEVGGVGSGESAGGTEVRASGQAKASSASTAATAHMGIGEIRQAEGAQLPSSADAPMRAAGDVPSVARREDLASIMPYSEIVDRRVHIYHPAQSAPSHRVYLVLAIAATREGFISQCAMVAVALATLMSVAYAELEAAAQNLAGFVVLLAAIPLVLGYLLVRSEDALEREGIVGVRALAVLSGMMPILGGLSLVLTRGLSNGGPLGATRPLWAGLTLAGWVIAASLMWSFCMAAPPREVDRSFRVGNIAAISGIVAAASLILANILVSQPYSGSAARHLATYVIGHRPLVIVAGALVLVAASALVGFVDALRRLARVQRADADEPADASERRTLRDRIAAALVIGTGEVLSLALAAAALLTVWRAMTMESSSEHAGVIDAANVIFNDALAPCAVLVVVATCWLTWRRQNLRGNPQLMLVGMLISGIAIALRVISVLAPGFPTIQSRFAWLGFAGWIALVALAVRKPTVGRHTSEPDI